LLQLIRVRYSVDYAVGKCTASRGDIIFVMPGHNEGGVGGSNNNDGSYRRPFATVDYAVGKCTASRGDIIFVMPGHNEGGVAAGLIAADVAGVAIVGLGTGLLRPTFDFDDTDVTIAVSAANVTLHNLRFRASVGDVVAGIIVTGTDCRIDSCEFTNEAAADNFIDFIATSSDDNAADRLSVTNCKVYSTDTGNNSFIELLGAQTGLELIGNEITLGVGAGESIIGFDTATDVLLNATITDNIINRLITDGPILIEGTANTLTGVVARNLIGHVDAAAPVLIPTGSLIRHFENYAAGAIDVNGRLWPAVEATSDMRLKENIQKIGMYLGHNIYTWTWNATAKALGINDPTVGVMAQEVMYTGCVTERDGWLRVNYGKLFG
jgi:hypothetical protein